ncbi:MAG: hypothetical protein BGO78_06210 [Chloroflexi bacterium 44-23]|nr:MAG: hypothetical protein BGO78_06210 [Chloroflexi bacterium 44-23]
MRSFSPKVGEGISTFLITPVFLQNASLGRGLGVVIIRFAVLVDVGMTLGKNTCVFVGWKSGCSTAIGKG